MMKKFASCKRGYSNCVKRSGDKTQMQSTHYNALGFPGSNDYMREHDLSDYAIQALYC